MSVHHHHPRLVLAALLLLGLAVPGIALAQVLPTYIPIPGLPTEDVDMVEMVPAGIGLPPTIVYPTETAVYYIDMVADVVYAMVPKPGPNISGADYVVSPDGAIGVMPILGALCVFSHGPGLPALTMTIPLPGTPARRDIDVTIVPGILNPWDAIYATGTEVHRVDLTTGAIWWTAPLPTPIVEAVDPLYVSPTLGAPMVFVATDGFMSEFNALSGIPPPGTPIPTGATVIREVDLRLNPAGTLVFLHANFLLASFNATTGFPVSSVTLPSMGIEGNDIEWDNTGTRGAAITVASMTWFNANTGAVTTTIPFFTAGIAYAHQRNQDVIFTAPGVVPQTAGYLAQGAFFIYNVPALPGAVTTLAVLPTPSPTMDGVDPLTTDAVPVPPAFPAGPAGVIALVPTQGWVSEVDLRTGIMAPPIPLVPGALRTDVDVRRGATPGNKNYQPYIGGVVALAGFLAGQYTVTVSTGVHIINVPLAVPAGFFPTGMIFRGGDEQVSTVLGPGGPGYTTDDPDQDFLTKCWEYKYTLNRWPMWYATSNPPNYPHFMPYGVFGPPALSGWDIWNDLKVMVLNNNQVAILDRKGFLRQMIPLPAPPIGGLVFDWDNLMVKLRLRGQQEVVIDLSSWYPTTAAIVTVVPYTMKTEWYPIVDRMNGWEFNVARGARQVMVYDDVNEVNVTSFLLPARIIRPPVFDEQRKTLVMPLANRQIAFFDAHKYRVSGLATALYYSTALPTQVAADPVFDLYNHVTLLHLYGGNVAVVDHSNGNVVFTTPPLPYWPVGPIQVDCYNKIAKWNVYNGLNYGEYAMDLYPLRNAAPPIVRFIALAGPPYGYPQFDSRDGWEFTRIGNTIQSDALFSPYATVSYTAAIPLTGNLFLDRVNKYGLVAANTPQVLYMNLFRMTSGLPVATQVIGLPSPATQGIHFLTQLHLAVVQLQSGQVAVIDLKQGTSLGTLPLTYPCKRQIYVQPFTGTVNYPAYDTGTGQAYDVTIDLNPLRSSPPGVPIVHNELLPAPTNEAFNFIPPAPPAGALILQLPPEAGDDALIKHFQLMPGAGAPGLNYQVDNGTWRSTSKQMNPVSGTLEDDGSTEFSVLAKGGESVCVRFYDPEGNASGEVCVPATQVIGVGDELITPASFSFALAGANPVTGEARFRFTLASAGRVELAVYDMAGRRVAAVLSEEMKPGEYDRAWSLTTASGRPAAPGVYFARFKAGSYEQSRRIVVLGR